MKKIFSLFMMLCVAIAASATDYDLWFDGIRVTSSNANRIHDSSYITYNASTKTLTLNGIGFTAQTAEVIKSNIDGLTIKVIGTVNLSSTASDRNTFVLTGKTTIVGSGVSSSTLNIKRNDATGGAGYQPIRANGNVDIKDITMNVTNVNGGTAIRPYNTPDSESPTAYTLSVTDANVTFSSAGKYEPIYGFKTLTLTGCSLNPSTYYKAEAKGYYVANTSGTSIKTDVVIKNRRYGSFGNLTISDSNCRNIKPSGLKSGTISLYEFAKGAGKYVYLDGVDFSSTTDQGLRLTPDEPCHMEVFLKGTNNIKAPLPLFIDSKIPGSVYIRAASNLTYSPILNLESTQYAGIDVRCPNLTFKDITLNVKGKDGGIDGFQGYNSDTHTLTFNNTAATIADNSTSKKGAIINIKSMSFTDCFHFGPSYYTFKNNVFSNQNGDSETYVLIHRGYGININGLDVTKDNINDVCNDGKVSYNPTTKTLNLKGIDYKSAIAILQVFTPITINLSGRNIINNTGTSSALYLYANATITGSYGATLAANTEKNFAGITVDQAGLTIKDCEVSVYSPNSTGVVGMWPQNYPVMPGTSTLTLNNASLVINNSSSKNCIQDFKKFTMTDCYFESPVNASFDTAKGYVKNGSSAVTGNVEISKGYGFIVAGTRVTKENASNIMSGVSYDAASNTLKLNNAKIIAENGSGIHAYKDLNIYVSGTANSITSNKQNGILALGNLNITGPGKSMSSLKINTSTQGYAGIYVNNANKKLSFTNTTVSARSTGINSYGIVGSKTAATIQNAEVTAYGTSASIYNLSSLSMTGVEIISPANAVFTPGVGVTLNGSVVAAKDVTIGVKDYKIAVGGTNITTANYTDLYGDGKVKYDPSNNTLTLNNAYIGTEGYGISAQTSERLYINLIGTNYVNSLRSYALYHDNKNGITIQSSSNGTLNLSGSTFATFQEAGNITVKNCNLKVNGMQGREGNNYCTLNIDNANVTSDCYYGAFQWIDNIYLSNCYVSEPVDAKFNSSKGGYLSGSKLCTKVVIKAGTASAIDDATIDNTFNSPAFDLRGVQVDDSHKGVIIKNGRKFIRR